MGLIPRFLSWKFTETKQHQSWYHEYEFKHINLLYMHITFIRFALRKLLQIGESFTPKVCDFALFRKSEGSVTKIHHELLFRVQCFSYFVCIYSLVSKMQFGLLTHYIANATLDELLDEQLLLLNYGFSKAHRFLMQYK